MARMTGGQAVARSLLAQGVDTLFGIISVHTLHLHDALYDVQDRVRYIIGRNEAGLAYMADGYARATGRPGVLLTSSGPGAADSVGAMGEAYWSSSSVLQITTNVERAYVNSGAGATHEPKDQLSMFRSVTGWNALVDSVEALPDHINEAFLRFKTHRPRPVELEVPTDLLGERADVEVFPPPAVEPSQGDPARVERAVELLLKARRPVIYAGEMVHWSGATPELVRLAETLGAPVVTSDGGKGTFPEDHPLALGPALSGFIWGTNPIHPFIASCDLALVVGATLPHRSTTRTGLRLPAPVIQIDLDPQVIGRNYPVAVDILGDPRTVLGQMLTLLEGRDGYKGAAFQREVQELKYAIHASLEEQWPNELRFFEGLRSVLPRETVFCLDPTVAHGRAVRCLPVYQPRTYMSPHGWSGLGFGLPAGIGAKAGVPHQPVVVITGDGGFQYNMQELGTAAQHGLSPIVLILNDNAWGILKQRQRESFQGRQYAVDLVSPNFVKLAGAYGLPSVRVRSLKELLRAVEDALSSDRLSLIEVETPQGFPNFR